MATILLVHTDARSRHLLTLLLQAEGYHVVTASKARAAHDRIDSIHPDLILYNSGGSSDHHGAWYHALRAQVQTRCLPIVVLSARTIT